MFWYLPRTTLYLEEEGKERLYVEHRGSGHFIVDDDETDMNWSDLHHLYKLCGPYTERAVCDILFVAAGEFKDKSISVLTDMKLPYETWKTIGGIALPYKRLDTFPPNTRCYMKKPYQPQLDVLHVRGGLFRLIEGTCLWPGNRHQLLKYYDEEHDSTSPFTDPLDVLYVDEGFYKNETLKTLFLRGLDQTGWVGVKESEIQTVDLFLNTRTVNGASVKTEINCLDLFTKALHLPQKLPVLRFGPQGLLSHDIGKGDPFRPVLHFQHDWGGKLICPTTDASVLEGLVLDRPDQISLRTLLERSAEEIARAAATAAPTSVAVATQAPAATATTTAPNCLQLLQAKEATLLRELKELEEYFALKERVKALEADVKEKQWRKFLSGGGS
jgi:hypothetical protein